LKTAILRNASSGLSSRERSWGMSAASMLALLRSNARGCSCDSEQSVLEEDEELLASGVRSRDGMRGHEGRFSPASSILRLSFSIYPVLFSSAVCILVFE
jgi:hypothetical protein